MNNIKLINHYCNNVIEYFYDIPPCFLMDVETIGSGTD